MHRISSDTISFRSSRCSSCGSRPCVFKKRLTQGVSFATTVVGFMGIISFIPVRITFSTMSNFSSHYTLSLTRASTSTRSRYKLIADLLGGRKSLENIYCFALGCLERYTGCTSIDGWSESSKASRLTGSS